MNPRFSIELHDEVIIFLESLDEKARDKIIYNLRKSQLTNDKVLFKKLNNNVWEFRTLYNNTKYRLFAFWDKTDKSKTIVITTHGIEKKTSKTPKTEIEKTERMMKLYFDLKK